MREFLVLPIVIAAVMFIGLIILSVVIFIAPIILSAVVFVLCAAAIISLLARLGILPGVYVRRSKSKANNRGSKSSWSWKWKSNGNGCNIREEGWYSTPQDGEEITLPESALRKEKDSKKNKR